MSAGICYFFLLVLDRCRCSQQLTGADSSPAFKFAESIASGCSPFASDFASDFAAFRFCYDQQAAAHESLVRKRSDAVL
jgi:hypothetical protein